MQFPCCGHEFYGPDLPYLTTIAGIPWYSCNSCHIGMRLDRYSRLTPASIQSSPHNVMVISQYPPYIFRMASSLLVSKLSLKYSVLPNHIRGIVSQSQSNPSTPLSKVGWSSIFQILTTQTVLLEIKFLTYFHDNCNAQQARVVRRAMETVQERCQPVNSRRSISYLARFGFAYIGRYSEILKDLVSKAKIEQTIEWNNDYYTDTEYEPMDCNYKYN